MCKHTQKQTHVQSQGWKLRWGFWPTHTCTSIPISRSGSYPLNLSPLLHTNSQNEKPHCSRATLAFLCHHLLWETVGAKDRTTGSKNIYNPLWVVARWCQSLQSAHGHGCQDGDGGTWNWQKKKKIGSYSAEMTWGNDIGRRKQTPAAQSWKFKKIQEQRVGWMGLERRRDLQNFSLARQGIFQEQNR